jgi:hypothetical protein
MQPQLVTIKHPRALACEKSEVIDMKIYSLGAIAAALAFGGAYAANMLATTQPIVAAAPMSDQDIKQKAQQISYDSIARDPTKYAGTIVVFEGKVKQSLYDKNDKDVLLRVGVTQQKYGIWDDVVWVYYQRKSKEEPRILENDMVRFWGEYTGIKTYKSVIGAPIQVPRVVSHIVERVAAQASVN